MVLATESDDKPVGLYFNMVTCRNCDVQVSVGNCVDCDEAYAKCTIIEE